MRLCRRATIAGVLAGAVAVVLASASAQAGTPGGQFMSVNPLVSPAGTPDPGFALFRCQRGVDPLGRSCYDPYQMCDGNSWIKSTSSPSSDPLVTGVGGTELTAAAYPSSCTNSVGCTATPTPGTYGSEIGWN